MAKENVRDKAKVLDALSDLLKGAGVSITTLEETEQMLKLMLQDRLTSPVVITIVANARDGAIQAITHNVHVTQSEALSLLSTIVTTAAGMFNREAMQMKVKEEATRQVKARGGNGKIPPLELEQTPPPASPVSETI